MGKKSLEVAVGLFISAGFVALLLLAFWVSGLTSIHSGAYYGVNAEFDNIGGLKVRAPVALSGVTIGKVDSITLNPVDFRANVHLLILKKYNNLPIDSSASIYTQGLLGSNYISLSPGFETEALKENDKIETTHSALILESLIGQLLFDVKNKDKDDKKEKP